MTVLAEDLAALVAALDAGREVSLSIVGWERANEPQFFTATLRPVAGNRRAFADIGDRAQLAVFLRELADALHPEPQEEGFAVPARGHCRSVSYAGADGCPGCGRRGPWRPCAEDDRCWLHGDHAGAHRDALGHAFSVSARPEEP